MSYEPLTADHLRACAYALGLIRDGMSKQKAYSAAEKKFGLRRGDVKWGLEQFGGKLQTKKTQRRKK